MPAILRASCVRPRSEHDGIRIFGADEDEFTLAADALERVLEQTDASVPLETVHLVGRFPASIDPWLPELLGHPATVIRHDSARGGFLLAVRAATGEHLGTHAIVIVDSPSSEPSRGSSAAAVALLIGSGPGIEISHSGAGVTLLPRSPPGVGNDPLTGPAFVLYSALSTGRGRSPSTARTVRLADLEFTEHAPIDWVGDWASPPMPPLLRSPNEDREAHLFAVSEGAYVPRPRYLENLPSRWRFVAERCGHCGSVTFPVRGSCRSCHRSDQLSRIALPTGGGTVVASTVVAKGGQPTEFDDQVETNGPYGVVLVELAPMVRVTLQVSGAPAGTVRIGDRIDTRLRRLYPMEGEWRYGRKAVPAAGAA